MDRLRLAGVAGSVAFMLLSAGSQSFAKGGAAGPDHAWTTYSNPRFGFSVCYPADRVRPQAAPANDDGRTFVAASGARIATWGSYNALDQTLADSAREDERRLAGFSGSVTYRAVRPDFYVLSGRQDGQVFYNRTALRGDRFTSVEVTYPDANRREWDPIAERVSRCFRPARP